LRGVRARVERETDDDADGGDGRQGDVEVDAGAG
jgi:hypothetical protein